MAASMVITVGEVSILRTHTPSVRAASGKGRLSFCGAKCGRSHGNRGGTRLFSNCPPLAAVVLWGYERAITRQSWGESPIFNPPPLQNHFQRPEMPSRITSRTTSSISLSGSDRGLQGDCVRITRCGFGNRRSVDRHRTRKTAGGVKRYFPDRQETQRSASVIARKIGDCGQGQESGKKTEKTFVNTGQAKIGPYSPKPTNYRKLRAVKLPLDLSIIRNCRYKSGTIFH
jgi:hypothetical protein